MNKKTFAFMAIPALAAIMFVGAFTPIAMAADPEQAADVQLDDGCNSDILSIVGLGAFGTITPEGQTEVHTNNARGNVTFMCNGVLDDLSLAPDRAVRSDTVSSSVTNSETGDVADCDLTITVTPSGKVSAICRG